METVDYYNKPCKTLVVVCNGVITTEDNNKGLDCGYILKLES